MKIKAQKIKKFSKNIATDGCRIRFEGGIFALIESLSGWQKVQEEQLKEQN